MAGLVVAHPPGRAAEREYAIGIVLGELLGLDHRSVAEPRDDVRITADGDDERAVHVADGLLGVADDEWLTEAALPARPLVRVDGQPVLYGSATAGPGLGVDVFGSVFFLVTRYEELIVRTRDEHGRFPDEASLLVAEGVHERPLAHEHAELLWAALRAAWPRLERRRREPSLRPSHDVDWPTLPRRPAGAVVRSIGGDVVRRRDPRLALDRLRWEAAARAGRTGRDPHDTFDWLMDLSEQAGVRSTFYVMAGVTRPDIDGGYDLGDPFIASLLRRIGERGHEIGLHPSYESFRAPDVIARELDALRQACERAGVAQEAYGARQHYLRWENPVTWRAYEDAGLVHDASLGFSAHAGFRTGMCVDYPVFDVAAGRALRLRERPLVVMEGALLDHAGLTHGGAEALIARLRDRTRAVGGDFTLLWHNSALLSRRDRDLYRRTVGA